ncbi:MAG: DUF4388 domain-containing protein [Myxococcales bacterium]|nr:DUF4388 domain-containing protein [Myxococcales bacterium]
MDPHLPAASTLGRALLRLTRGRATGTLNVRGPARGRLVLHAGKVVAVDLPGTTMLGELLAVDRDGHARALEGAPPSGPIGRWLVARQLAEAPAVAYALRRQMRARVTAMFRWPECELRFEPIAAALPALEEPVPVADLVLSALRGAVDAVPADAERRIRDGRWVVDAKAWATLEQAALFPEERAMLPVLLRGGTGADALALGAERPRALRALYAWQLVGLAQPNGASAGDARHQTLLRKRLALRRGLGAEALLDLQDDMRTEGSTDDGARAARERVRRLVRDVHPDRFDPRLHAACGEVLQALLTAQSRLRRP